tara:strand:+ start:778 stop:1539 length:762 start_codon:yes stop_codon:yes gene_type:complete
MDAYLKSILALKKEKENDSSKINVIDIGCARCGFINEFLVNYFKREKIKCVGVDPLLHPGKFSAKKAYNYYFQGCVDNVPKNLVKRENFYINADDQASSLLKINTDLFSSNLNKRQDKFYYPQPIINRLKIINEVKTVYVFHLGNIIDKCFDQEEIIDFIKIDAEGKDLEIVKSIKDYLPRIKYIGVECSSHQNKDLTLFKNSNNTIENNIAFFKENNFSIFEITDYGKKNNNLTQMSDIVFINNNFNNLNIN